MRTNLGAIRMGWIGGGSCVVRPFGKSTLQANIEHARRTKKQKLVSTDVRWCVGASVRWCVCHVHLVYL